MMSKSGAGTIRGLREQKETAKKRRGGALPAIPKKTGLSAEKPVPTGTGGPARRAGFRGLS
eukprot:525042-Hanusia_phi.AAC.1